MTGIVLRPTIARFKDISRRKINSLTDRRGYGAKPIAWRGACRKSESIQ